MPIFDIIQYLFDQFGRVTPEMLRDMEAKVYGLAYDPV